MDALLGHWATGIDTRRNQVVATRNGRSKRVAFDRLLIATGALAERPVLPGIDLPGVFCLRDFDDAVGIMRYAEKNRLFDRRLETRAIDSAPRAVFLGGGPVCLQARVPWLPPGVRLAHRSSRIRRQALNLRRQRWLAGRRTAGHSSEAV